jgi:hypothetical protein
VFFVPFDHSSKSKHDNIKAIIDDDHITRGNKLNAVFWSIYNEKLEYSDIENFFYRLIDQLNLSGESLFLRKLVLGIPAQASSKNLTRPLMPSAPDKTKGIPTRRPVI